jgi:hypothetical protein
LQWNVPSQVPFRQSVLTKQASVALQRKHAFGPPQSRSVSVPFVTPSLQLGAMQTLPVQTPLVQSVGALQALPSMHALQPLPPPQSTSVSVPFFTVSLQAGATQTLPVQTPLPQSVPATHALPTMQREQPLAPPQSTSVSLPFFTVSLQAGAMQTLFVQTLLAQSAATTQTLPFAHVGQPLPPPQSVSVSVPFFTVSMQLAATHAFAVQTPLAQSPPTLHSTQVPSAAPPGVPQTLPPPTAHAPAAGVCWTVPFEQVSDVHTLLSLFTSALSGTFFVAPLPSQTACLQSPATWLASGVRSITFEVPQQPAMQVRSTHSLLGSGQSVFTVATVQLLVPPPQEPPAPPIPPMPPPDVLVEVDVEVLVDVLEPPMPPMPPPVVDVLEEELLLLLEVPPLPPVPVILSRSTDAMSSQPASVAKPKTKAKALTFRFMAKSPFPTVRREGLADRRGYDIRDRSVVASLKANSFFSGVECAPSIGQHRDQSPGTGKRSGPTTDVTA